jgi:hypothetical protein
LTQPRGCSLRRFLLRQAGRRSLAYRHRFTWVTLHPEFMDDYQKQRSGKRSGCTRIMKSWRRCRTKSACTARRATSPAACQLPLPGHDSSASSGGYAAKVALEDGFDRVVLAGVPMDPAASHFTRGKPWLQRDSFTIGFQKSVPHFAGRVRSMSGWTKELLGMPDPAWLNGETPQPHRQAASA